MMGSTTEWITDPSQGRIDEYLAAMFAADPTVKHPWVIVHWQTSDADECGLKVTSNIGHHETVVLDMLTTAVQHIYGTQLPCALQNIKPVMEDGDG